MSAFSTGNAAKLLKPGLNVIWGTYKDQPFEYRDLYDVQSSDKQYEEDQLMPGLGLLSVKTEGAPVVFQNTSQGLTTRTTHVAYASGFMITFEAIRDNQYKSKALKGSRMLMKAARVTKETVAANPYNRAHNSSYLGADGKVMCATDHPTSNGSQSNRLTTAADFSEASLEDLCVIIDNAKDDVGLPAALEIKSLHIPTSLRFEAARVLKSLGQSGSANNDTNALRVSGMFKGDPKVSHYFDDDDAFFIRTDADQGMVFYQREEAIFDEDNEFDTKNLKYSVYERYAVNWTDFRGVYSNGGGA
jgi:hypothetical protein